MKAFVRKIAMALGITAALAIGTMSFLPMQTRMAIAQGIVGIFQNGIPTGPSVYGIGDPTAGIYFGTNRTGVSGHLETGLGTGDLPVLSACGTSPALATGSTDSAGKITVGTSASAGCTLTFGTAYTSAPFCVYQNMTTGAPANVATVIAATIIWSSVLADSTVLVYHCIAASGG